MGRLELMLSKLKKVVTDKTVIGYKFVSTDMKSFDYDQTWEVGKWYMHDGKVSLEKSGFCASPNLYSAYENFNEEGRLFEVEARGIVQRRILIEENGFSRYYEFAAKTMRFGKEIDPKLSIDYAISCAKHVLPIYEKNSLKDSQPRKAIEAAEAYLRDPSAQTKSAAEYAGSVLKYAAQAADSNRSLAKERKWKKKLLDELVKKYYLTD